MVKADLGDVTLDYSEFGDGPPVVGVMGFSLDKRFWSAQVPAVSGTHRFITFDNRGIGRSTGPAVSTIDEMANDTIRLMDHLEIDTTVIFGVSMGGAVAQRLTLDHPDRVSALILAVTFARPIEYMRRQHELGRHLARARGARGVLEGAMLRMFTPRFFELGRETIDQMFKAVDTEGPENVDIDVLRAQVDAIDKFDVLEELPRIQVPTLVLGGKMDMLVPAFASEEIAAAIPGAELVMFETGHGCMIEEMPAFNTAVGDFLQRVSPPS